MSVKEEFGFSLGSIDRTNGSFRSVSFRTLLIATQHGGLPSARAPPEAAAPPRSSQPPQPDPGPSCVAPLCLSFRSGRGNREVCGIHRGIPLRGAAHRTDARPRSACAHRSDSVRVEAPGRLPSAFALHGSPLPHAQHPRVRRPDAREPPHGADPEDRGRHLGPGAGREATPDGGDRQRSSDPGERGHHDAEGQRSSP